MGPRLLTRRNLLANTAQSVGIAGLAAVLGGEASAASGPLAAKPPHFAPRAKRIIHLWMNGGPSQVDTFDRLAREIVNYDDLDAAHARMSAREVVSSIVTEPLTSTDSPSATATLLT